MSGSTHSAGAACGSWRYASASPDRYSYRTLGPQSAILGSFPSKALFQRGQSIEHVHGLDGLPLHLQH
jgi:hypothetical protein